MVGFWDPGVPNVGAPGYEGAAQRLADILERTYDYYKTYHGLSREETADLLRDIQEMKPWYEGGRRMGGEGQGIPAIREYFEQDWTRALDAFSLKLPWAKAWAGLKGLGALAWWTGREHPDETIAVTKKITTTVAEKMTVHWGAKNLDVVMGRVPTGEYPEYTFKFWTRKEAASGVQRRGLFYTRRGEYPSSIDPWKTTSAQVVATLRRGIRSDTIADMSALGYEVAKSLGKNAMEQVNEETEKKAQEAIEMAWFTRRRRGYGRGYNRTYGGGYRRGYRRGYSRYGGYRRSYGGYRSRYTPRRRWY